MFPNREGALEILYDAEKSNPGGWVNHCLIVGQCAEKIAARCGLDEDKAYVLGLLHDIGRKFGKFHFGHVVQGYRYMLKLGYDEVARICLTHSFPTKNIDEFIGEFDMPQEDIEEMKAILEQLTYDEYDKLIQICDCLAGSEGVMNMKARMIDVEQRYGYYPEQKRVKNLGLKKYFEDITGENIYRIITKDEYLWGL